MGSSIVYLELLQAIIKRAILAKPQRSQNLGLTSFYFGFHFRCFGRMKLVAVALDQDREAGLERAVAALEVGLPGEDLNDTERSKAIKLVSWRGTEKI